MSTALLGELNRDIWQPFRAAYTRIDADSYLALHAPDLVRVEADERWVGDLDDYAARVRPAFTHLATNNTRLAIDFRFLDRIASANHASERGIYRLTVTPPTAEPRLHFAQFHTIARKDNGTWRIILDHDHSENHTINATHYTAAHALDDLEPFS